MGPRLGPELPAPRIPIHFSRLWTSSSKRSTANVPMVPGTTVYPQMPSVHIPTGQSWSAGMRGTNTNYAGGCIVTADGLVWFPCRYCPQLTAVWLEQLWGRKRSLGIWRATKESDRNRTGVHLMESSTVSFEHVVPSWCVFPYDQSSRGWNHQSVYWISE